MKKEISAYFRKMGRKGGKARLESTTPEQRREWARLGGLAKSKGDIGKTVAG